jgi:hypothetical protein
MSKFHASISRWNKHLTSICLQSSSNRFRTKGWQGQGNYSINTNVSRWVCYMIRVVQSTPQHPSKNRNVTWSLSNFPDGASDICAPSGNSEAAWLAIKPQQRRLRHIWRDQRRPHGFIWCCHPQFAIHSMPNPAWDDAWTSHVFHPPLHAPTLSAPDLEDLTHGADAL